MKITLLKADGTEKDLTEKKRLTLGQMQKYVGGYIEIIELAKNKQLVADEDGKSKNYPLNAKASEIMRKKYPSWTEKESYIVGDTLLFEDYNWK